MPYFETEINIEPWEYVSSCNKSEIKSLISALIDEKHISSVLGEKGGELSVLDIEWDDICDKIRKSRLLLTSDEENFIKNVSDRL